MQNEEFEFTMKLAENEAELRRLTTVERCVQALSLQDSQKQRKMHTVKLKDGNKQKQNQEENRLHDLELQKNKYQMKTRKILYKRRHYKKKLDATKDIP